MAFAYSPCELAEQRGPDLLFQGTLKGAGMDEMVLHGTRAACATTLSSWAMSSAAADPMFALQEPLGDEDAHGFAYNGAADAEQLGQLQFGGSLAPTASLP